MENSSLWKLSLEPGKLYKSQINDFITVTKALLPLTPGNKKSGIVQVQLISRDEILTVCSLSLKHGVLQASLDLCFKPNDIIGFTLSGTPTPVQLLGTTTHYFDYFDDSSLSDLEDFRDSLQSFDEGLSDSKSRGSPSKKRKLSLDTSNDLDDFDLEVVGTKAKIYSNEGARKKKKLSNGVPLYVETQEKTTKKSLSVKGNKEKSLLKSDKLAYQSELENGKGLYRKDISKLPKLHTDVKSNEQLSRPDNLKKKLEKSAVPKCSNDQKSPSEKVSISSVKKSTKIEAVKNLKKSPKSISEKSPKSISEKSPKSISEKSPKSISEKIPKSISEKSSKSISEKSLKSISEKSSKSISGKSPKSVNDKKSKSVSENSPKLSPKTLFDQFPKSVNELKKSSEVHVASTSNTSQKSPTKTDNTPQVLKGGIQAVDKSVGSGTDVEKGKVVGIFYQRYEGSNEDPIENNTSKAPLRFSVGSREVPRGLDIGVRGMKVGGKRTIVVPTKAGKKRKDQIRFEVTVVSCQ